MITIEGVNGIKATVLAYSISQEGKMIITWEIEYPRLILAELNTHRQLSRNSYSSRAVPFLKMLEQLNGEPVRFGVNQGGMQDKGEDFNAPVWIDGQSYTPREAWRMAKESAIEFARAFFEAGYHKQVYNRRLEADQMQKTVLSATEDENFFWLRDDDAADPTIRELARVMKEAKDTAVPVKLKAGEWHLPYVDVHWDTRGWQHFYIKDISGMDAPLTVEEAIKVSCARCAAVSYRNEGYDLAKSLEVYENLVGGDRKHASAFEHCATPIAECVFSRGYEGDKNINHLFHPATWEEGITHVDRRGNLWSGNFQGWIQYRKLIPGECYSSEN